MPDLNYVAIKTESISNCTKTLQCYIVSLMLLLHSYNVTFYIVTSRNIMKSLDQGRRSALISRLSFFACLECIVTLFWMFSLVSKFSLMFWMYRMLFYTPVLLFVVSESTALVFSILKEHRPSSLFCDSSALVFPTCYFNLTKADLFYFRDGMSSWHFQFCLKLGASFVIQLLLDFFFFFAIIFF